LLGLRDCQVVSDVVGKLRKPRADALKQLGRGRVILVFERGDAERQLCERAGSIPSVGGSVTFDGDAAGGRGRIAVAMHQRGKRGRTGRSPDGTDDRNDRREQENKS
jgi:hypothetical protein